MSIQLENELQSFTFVGGDFQVLEFNIIDSVTTEPVDLTTFTSIRWVLFHYGDPDTPLLNLVGDIVAADHSKFNVFINSEYTRDLEGLFIQQPVLIDSEGKEFHPGQGQINIIARGKADNSTIIEKKTS